MKNLNPDKEIKKKIKEVQYNFLFGVLLYIFAFSVAIQYCVFKRKGENWCYFGLVIGAIFVFFAFYYFYENHLRPYMQEIKKKVIKKEKQVFFRLIEWILPAIGIQLFIFVGFWLTVANIPFKGSLYVHPYMYGQVYKKIENYLGPEIPAAGLAIKPSEVLTDEMKNRLLRRGKVLENEFSGYLKNWEPPENTTDQTYLNIIIDMISDIYKIPFYIALTFSFLGTLMYTLNNALYRFLIEDLYSKTFVSYLIRFLFAPALGLIIAYFMMNEWWTNGAPALFFIIGFFPRLALQFIEDKIRTFLKYKKEEKKEVPLNLIQGITEYAGYRLKELGVGDAQNLAYCDLNFLRNWYNDRLLCDFVAQALLLIHLREDFSKLQDVGIRNIIAFKNILSDQKKRQEIGEKLGIKEKLDTLNKLVGELPLAERIGILEGMIKKFDNREVDNLPVSG